VGPAGALSPPRARQQCAPRGGSPGGAVVSAVRAASAGRRGVVDPDVVRSGVRIVRASRRDGASVSDGEGSGGVVRGAYGVGCVLSLATAEVVCVAYWTRRVTRRGGHARPRRPARGPRVGGGLALWGPPGGWPSGGWGGRETSYAPG
jgi:hypothetical protein